MRGSEFEVAEEFDAGPYLDEEVELGITSSTWVLPRSCGCKARREDSDAVFVTGFARHERGTRRRAPRPCRPSLPVGDLTQDRILGGGLSFVPVARRTPCARGDDDAPPLQEDLEIIQQEWGAAVRVPLQPRQVARAMLNSIYLKAVAADEHYQPATSSTATVTESDEEFDPVDRLCGTELEGVGSVATEKYSLHVCLGDRIPIEAGAARVKTSRIMNGPEWREFLQKGEEGILSDGIPMDNFLQCPCCLSLLRRPVALPCGHSLCRSCLTRLPGAPSAPSTPRGRGSGVGGQHLERRCPLCRAAIPRGRLRVNERLDQITETLHAFRLQQEGRRSPGWPPTSPSRESSPGRLSQ